MDLATRYPLDNIVELGPGNFHTVREVEENGWMLPAQGPVRIPQPVSNGIASRPDLKRPAPDSHVAQPGAKRVATSFGSSNDSAISMANLIKITEVEQSPDFWTMPVHELVKWRQCVVILDRTIQGYFQAALKEAEDDLDQAASEEAAWRLSIASRLETPLVPDPVWKHVIRASRSMKEETPAPIALTSPAFKFNSYGPNRLDLVYMRALEAMSPFGAEGQKGKVVHECAIWLKNNAGTRQHFGNLSDSPNSRVLQVRYTQLKTWLAAAEGWSKMDIGTEEDDKELRQLICSVQDEEEPGRALRLAGQEEREAVKGQSLLVEAVREQFADKAVQDYEASVGESEKDSQPSPSSRKGQRAAHSNPNTSTDELAAFTGKLGRWNNVSLAAQAEQKTRINELCKQELVIAHKRNENKCLMSQSLAAHRTAELALQQQRLEFDKSQVN
ncbi:hypothetical protein DFH28DRAFT_1078160 [Melampsora americana]|nr:hypothetical protein DFH28DRAFT_1078160 [Melampsora americana]